MGIESSAAARPTSATTISGRRRIRSIQIPAGSAKSKNGSVSIAASAATANVLASRTRMAVSGSAISVTCVPIVLIVCAPQSFRKSRCAQRPVGLRTGSGGRHEDLLRESLLFGGLRHLLDRAYRREQDRQEREEGADPTDPERRPEAEPRGERAAAQRAERHRPPDEEADDRVHASLEPRWADRLPEAELRDVVGDRSEAAEDAGGDEERSRDALRRRRVDDR